MKEEEARNDEKNDVLVSGHDDGLRGGRRRVGRAGRSRDRRRGFIPDDSR